MTANIIKKSTRKQLKLTKQRQHAVRKYPISDIAALEDLQKMHKGRSAFQYDFETNKNKRENKLIIAPCDLMGGRLGVYATENIKVSHNVLGKYAGKRSKRGGSADSLYAFQISDNEGRLIEFIDADKRRDWTGFINHSPCSNVCIEQRKINGKYEILFYPERQIKQGEQLLYNYGEFYFTVANIKPFYLHASDNWRTSEEVYLENKEFYVKDRYIFTKKVSQDLGLPISKSIDHILPIMLISLLQGKVNEVKKWLDRSHPVELLVYGCDKDRILHYAKQQHLTPLMFACYLGHYSIIKILLQHGADPSRRTLNGGRSPFDILLSGLGDQHTKNVAGKLLIKKMHQISVVDQNGLSALHYAVIENMPVLAKMIIKRFEDERHDWLKMLFNKNEGHIKHASFDYCLEHGYFNLLRLLMQSAVTGYGKHKDGLLNFINRKRCFQQSLLEQLSAEYLAIFKKMLKLDKFKLINKNTDLIKRVERAIKKKS